MPEVIIQEQWKELLKEEFSKDYFIKLVDYIKQEKNKGYTIYPKGKLIFNAFELTPFDKVKVVILGQDPYHGVNQAHGLSFSVQDGVTPPPSLKNIYKEIENDLNIKIGNSGNLEPWAKQGVLLLNSSLTVRASEAASHSKIGWEIFTDSIIKILSSKKENLVFLLWGNFAKAKSILIDNKKHLILEAAHPSPLARGAFFGCRHFSKCNNYLISKGLSPIDWSI